MRLARPVAIVVFLAAFPAYSGWVCEPVLGDPESCQWVYERDYHVLLNEEPSDWCLYGTGDEVWINWQNVNGHLEAVQLYIVPAAQAGQGQPHSSCASGPYYVGQPIGGECNLFMP